MRDESGSHPDRLKETAPYRDIAPIFVVGLSRSGSTLLRLMLNAHPEIQLLGELQFFDVIYPLRKRVPDLENPGALREISGLIEKTSTFRYLQEGNELLEAVVEHMEEGGPRTFSRFHRELLLEYARRHDASRCGEKSPENLRYLPSLLTCYPRAKIVHIVRDPRDVVTSWRSVPWASPDVLTSALRWTLETSFARDGRIRSRTESFFELRYEDLVGTPDRELRRLCEFLGEQYSPAMLNFYDHAPEQVNLDAEPWKARTARALDTSRVGRWKATLSMSEVALVQGICGRGMRFFSYELRTVPLGHRLAWPVRACVETVRWLRYKASEPRSRSREDADLIYPSRWNGLRMMFRAVPVWLRSRLSG